MSKAVKDYHPSAKSGLTRDPNGESTYSASGIYGDATLATRQKGAIVVKAIADGILGRLRIFRVAISLLMRSFVSWMLLTLIWR